MVVTILEAQVAPEMTVILKKAYKDGAEHLDDGIVETFLIQSLADSHLWRIVTVWRSREALDAMRNSSQTPRGVLMFRAAQAEPVLSVFDVAAYIHA